MFITFYVNSAKFIKLFNNDYNLIHIIFNQCKFIKILNKFYQI